MDVWIPLIRRYIADEPDGAHWDPNITSMVYNTVKETDTRRRPVALCVDTTPSSPGSWQQFVPYTDIIMPDICELPTAHINMFMVVTHSLSPFLSLPFSLSLSVCLSG